METAIKIARKWGYEKKGVAENAGLIVVCEGNFHGRTTIVFLSLTTKMLVTTLVPIPLDL